MEQVESVALVEEVETAVAQQVVVLELQDKDITAELVGQMLVAAAVVQEDWGKEALQAWRVETADQAKSHQSQAPQPLARAEVVDTGQRTARGQQAAVMAVRPPEATQRLTRAAEVVEAELQEAQVVPAL